MFMSFLWFSLCRRKQKKHSNPPSVQLEVSELRPSDFFLLSEWNPVFLLKLFAARAREGTETNGKVLATILMTFKDRPGL